MEDRGLFIKPTVFSEVTDTMRIAKEEVLGLQEKPCPVGPCAELGPRGVGKGAGPFKPESSPGPRDPRNLCEGTVFLFPVAFPLSLGVLWEAVLLLGPLSPV